MPYILDESSDEIRIKTLDQCKQFTLLLAEQARRNIDIFTQNLEPEIYNTINFEQAIFNLSKKHPSTRIRILVQDSRKAVQDGHRLIKVSQQLTSSVFIHNPPEKYKKEQSAFILADGVGHIHQALATSRTYNAKVNFKAPSTTKILGELFETIWQQSAPDVQTRRVYL